jgi:hypothetical protein
MLSERGNPNMDNLAAIFSAISKNLNVHIAANVSDLPGDVTRPSS